MPSQGPLGALRTRKLVPIIGWLVLPPLLTFAAQNNSAFRPQPSNGFYDGMFITIATSLACLQAYLSVRFGLFSPALAKSGSEAVVLPDSLRPHSALDFFELLFTLFLAVLYFAAGAPGSGTIWLMYFALLLTCHYMWWKQSSNCSFVPALRLGRWRQVVLAFFYILWAVGFLTFPVFQSWNGFVAPFVRWFEYSVPNELVWRGIFASYALGMLYTVLDPFNKHLTFIIFVAVSGTVHATFMLAANLVSRALDLPNGNPQHLYGDVLGWYVIACFSAVNLVGTSLTVQGTEASPVNKFPPESASAPNSHTIVSVAV